MKPAEMPRLRGAGGKRFATGGEARWTTHTKRGFPRYRRVGADHGKPAAGRHPSQTRSSIIPTRLSRGTAAVQAGRSVLRYEDGKQETAADPGVLASATSPLLV